MQKCGSNHHGCASMCICACVMNAARPCSQTNSRWIHAFVQIALEEKFLMERYGTTYDDYRATVKKLVPYLY